MENAYNQALERLRQEVNMSFKDSLRNREFETSQGYKTLSQGGKKRKKRKKRPFAIKGIKGYYRNRIYR